MPLIMLTVTTGHPYSFLLSEKEYPLDTSSSRLEGKQCKVSVEAVGGQISGGAALVRVITCSDGTRLKQIRAKITRATTRLPKSRKKYLGSSPVPAGKLVRSAMILRYFLTEDEIPIESRALDNN